MNTEAILRQFGENQVAGFLLVLGRIGPLFALAPLFSSNMIPGRVKGLCALGLTVGIAPIALGKREIPLEIMGYTELMLKEILVGVAFAFALAALFAAVSTAGAFIDTLIGFSYGSLVDPITGNQSSVLTQAYTLVGVAVLIAIGGDQLMIKGLARSYALVPLLDAPSLKELAPSLVGGVQAAFSQVFRSALELSAPVVLAIVITDGAFGVVSRVVPQLNVFAVGFPAKVTVGLLIISVSLPFTAGWMAEELERSVSTALRSLS